MNFQPNTYEKKWEKIYIHIFQIVRSIKNIKGSLKYSNIHLIIDNLKNDTIDILASLDYETLSFAYFEIW